MDDPKVNILLVDDDRVTLATLENILAPLDQHLITANSGKEALRWLLDDECAVILLDVRMPVMDGFETAALIREREKTRYTPIIFLTGVRTDEIDVTQGYSLGAVDYLVKPLVPDVLRGKVAVFVELFRERTREVTELRETLATMSLGEEHPDLEPLAHPNERTLDKLRPAYRNLMLRYIRSVQLHEGRPAGDVREFARKLTKVECRARDVVSLHLAVLTEFSQRASPAEDRALANDARLMLVELMGVLMDTYRTRVERQEITGVPHP